MKKFLIIFSIAVQSLIFTMMVGVLAPTSAEATLMLFSIDGKEDTLYRLDPSDASSISSVTMTLTGENVSAGIGLATNPLTGDLWALLKIESSDRELVILDPFTGVATSIGNTGDKFQGLAFDSAGTLFGVLPSDDTLYTLSQSDATPTSFLTGLDDDDDPQVIAFNSDDGLLYHAGGYGDVFETVDLVSPFDIIDIDISDTALEDDQVQALTYWEDEGVFLWKQDNGSGPLFRVTSDGVETLIGTVDHHSRGLAFFDDEFGQNGTGQSVVPEPATMLLFGSGMIGAFLKRRRKT